MWVFATVYAYTSYHDDEETEGCLRRAKDGQMEWDGRKPGLSGRKLKLKLSGQAEL